MPQNIYLQLLGQRTPNPAQVIGSAGRQLGQDLSESEKTQLAMQELVQRRQAAILANKVEERRLAEAETEASNKAADRATADALQKRRQEGLKAIFQHRMKNGQPLTPPTPDELDALDIPGTPETMAQSPMGAPQQPLIPQPGPMPMAPGAEAPMGGVSLPEQDIYGTRMPEGYAGMENNMDQSAGFDPNPMTRQRQLELAAQYENITPEQYFQATDPTRDPQYILDKLATQAGYNIANQNDRQEFAMKLAKFQAGNRERLKKMGTGIKPKNAAGMPMRPITDTSVKRLTDIRNAAWNIKKIEDIADGISSLKFGPFSGAASARNPYDAQIKRLINAINATVPSMARGVFGEVGVLTDKDMERYASMFPALRTDPTVAMYIVNDIKEKVGAAWPMQINTLADANYDVSGFDPELTFDELADQGRHGGRPAPAPVADSGGIDDAERVRREFQSYKAKKR